MNKLEYQPSKSLKSRTFIVLIFSLLMGVGLLYYIGDPLSWKSILVYLFLLISLLSSVRVLIRKTTLWVDEKGLHSAINGMKLLEWKYVDHFEIKENNKQSFLVVYLNDTELFLQRKNSVSRLLMRSNVKALGSPVALPQAEFDKPLEEVKKELEVYQKA